MTHPSKKELRAVVSEYTVRSNKLAVLIFSLDVLTYVACILGVIFLENMFLKVFCSVLAGFKIASLFIIGHDAAHDAFANNKMLNAIIARIVFLPSLHNYGLWKLEHNRIHHQATNVKGMDSWSPFSKEEYDVLPVWRKVLERFYRSIYGIGSYYMIERWWKNKFYPFESIKGKYNSTNWDFLLVVSYLVSYLSLLVYSGQVLPFSGSIELVVLGFLLPFLIWNFMMGFTVYQHHTHETIKWNKSIKDRESLGGQEDFTMYVKYPDWYNLVSFNIMVHTAHHVNPRIPLYHLPKAQNKIAEFLGDDLNEIKFSFVGFITTLAKCKLYDYENNNWLDFEGNITSDFKVEDESIKLADVA